MPKDVIVTVHTIKDTGKNPYKTYVKEWFRNNIKLISDWCNPLKQVITVLKPNCPFHLEDKEGYWNEIALCFHSFT